jgi:hypothetical protein
MRSRAGSGVAVAAVLALSACSGTSSAPTGHSKTLTADQLEAAGLTASELSAGYGFVGTGWTPPGSPTRPITGQPACQPLIELFQATTPAASTMVASLQSGADTVNLQLSAFSPDQAQAFFADVKRSVPACAGMTYSAYGQSVSLTFEPLPAPGGGDDSFAFGAIRTMESTGSVTDRYEYVRAGAETVLLEMLGTPIQGPLPSSMLAKQVAKLQAAQSG